MSDPTLEALVIDRRRMLRDLAPVLNRAGGSHPKRSTENRRRSRQRREIRDRLRENADHIASRVVSLYNREPYADVLPLRGK